MHQIPHTYSDVMYVTLKYSAYFQFPMCLQNVLRDNFTFKTLSDFVLTTVLIYHQITWKEFCKYRSFATRVSQLKIWHFWVIGIERNVCRCTFKRYSVVTQFAKPAAGEQLCRHCTHRKLQYFKKFKSLSWKITHFELWYCCRKWATCSV
jgi:hypothetical protein